MLPGSIRSLLRRVRGRERAQAMAWTAAKWFSGVAVLTLLCCVVDYTIDLYRDSPAGARGVGRLVIALLFVAACARVILAARRRIGNQQAALWIEGRCPDFHHRLISAVEFDAAGAKTRGMSAELIDAVTKQAAEQARGVAAGRVIDGTRARRAAWLAGPIFGGLLLLVLLNSSLAGVLLGRLFYLEDRTIPRRVTFAPLPGGHWPAGEEIEVRLRVFSKTGWGDESGMVRVKRKDGTVSWHPLGLHEIDPEDPKAATFAARIPPGDDFFTFSARLGDGRTHDLGRVDYVPRPVVQSVESWVQLPASIGLRPDRSRYEEPQKGGDIVHRLPGSLARVRVVIQKPIARALVHVLGESPRTTELARAADAQSAEGTFALRPGDSGYEVEVRDEHNFANADRPGRTISQGSLPPPDVTLLPESFAPPDYTGPKEDYEAEGVPVAVGAPFRLEYACSHPYGISHVVLRYRVLARGAARDDSGAIDLSKFLPLPLGPPRGGKDKPTARALREFATRPASPDAVPDSEGGGIYDFELAGIPDGQGGRLTLKEGDRIQFFVEAYGKADADGAPGRSVVREKEVVSEKAYADWFVQKINLTERARELEERQRGAAPPGGGQSP